MTYQLSASLVEKAPKITFLDAALVTCNAMETGVDGKEKGGAEART